MTNIVGVKFKYASKIYHFDANDLELNIGDYVIVETAIGVELGKIMFFKDDVDEETLNKPLKPILRVASDKDLKVKKENEQKKDEIITDCQKIIENYNLEMNLVDVEFTIDNSKIVFYFTADGRIDFRDLVRTLASKFKKRIELRQIGVRDEAKMLGGIGVCGRSLCCNKWLTEFKSVSIKMAKTQKLSLNPTNISGVCGRLMCCLQYENDNYVEAYKNMPKIGDNIKIKEGICTVLEIDVLPGTLKVKTNKKDGEDEILTINKKDIIKILNKKCGNCCNK
ncbi:MAG: stage 0 sporulation family protein [Eubacteriales bacterium]|nr:stage 0 sporulation family protein [Eubacteriales bacterium]MDY3332917.1 stage 0 sporulation family protein [Gallibacter sp.]